jgi:hypothetical protein
MHRNVAIIAIKHGTIVRQADKQGIVPLELVIAHHARTCAAFCLLRKWEVSHVGDAKNDTSVTSLTP